MRRAQRLLQAVEHIRNEGSRLAHWYVTGEDTGYVNLKNLRLVIADTEGIHVMPGTVTRDKDNQQRLLFSATNLCRISNGRRRGMFVDPVRLRPGENASKAGLYKPFGRGPECLRAGNRKDVAIVDTLCGAAAEAIAVESLLIPTFHIRSSSVDNLSLRLKGEVTKELVDLEEYDRSLSLEDNFTNLADAFATKDGSHTYYEFDKVTGLGLVMFDSESLPPPQWLKCDGVGHDLLEVHL